MNDHDKKVSNEISGTMLKKGWPIILIIIAALFIGPYYAGKMYGKQTIHRKPLYINGKQCDTGDCTYEMIDADGNSFTIRQSFMESQYSIGDSIK